jgi:glycosyltransferase involved in cell wall biosynthesis
VKVALIYDWLNQFGGGERVLSELHSMFPEAPVFTTVHAPEKLPESMRCLDVRTSFLQRVPMARGNHRPFFPLMPMAFERFDLEGFDLVLSASSACAKGVIPGAGSTHLCYCFSPCRYLWDSFDDYTSGKLTRPLMAGVARWMRRWDRETADRVDHFVAISDEVASRIDRNYQRSAEVVYPPVDVEAFAPSGGEPGDYYLVVSRLVAYKRIDLAIAAANRLGRRLIVVGDGPERARLAAMAGPTVEMRGRLPDEEIRDLYAGCRAFVFPAFEDFGIAPVEAQAAGRPVIAFGRGGATETVVNGRTGVFFDAQQIEALVEAMLEFERGSFDPRECRRNAERFDRRAFRRGLRASIDRCFGRGAETPVPVETGSGLVAVA